MVRLAKRSQICNLGQDVDKTHRLRQDAMERVFGCVAAYVEEARRAGATSACCTLTSAARDAQNARELGAALASLGLEPMVIPGAVEGSLTFLGVAQDFVGHRILVPTTAAAPRSWQWAAWERTASLSWTLFAPLTLAAAG